MNTKKFTSIEMEYEKDQYSFSKWKKEHPKAEIVSITPVPKYYIDVDYLVVYNDQEEKKDL